MSKHPMPDFVWRIVNRKGRLSGPESITHITFPAGILGSPDKHYVLFDSTGVAKCGARTFREAMQIKSKTGFYIARILNRVPANRQ